MGEAKGPVEIGSAEPKTPACKHMRFAMLAVAKGEVGGPSANIDNEKAA